MRREDDEEQHLRRVKNEKEPRQESNPEGRYESSINFEEVEKLDLEIDRIGTQ